VHYKKAPIIEAVLEFRWASAKSLDELTAALSLPAFEGFGDPKPRHLINASLNVQTASRAVTMAHEQQHVGFEISLRDGSKLVILEQDKFVFVQRAPYDCWKYYSERALALLGPVAELFKVAEFSRIGVRFVNRIDIPFSDARNFNTDDYITVKFDGPRPDAGIIDEFQMRLVKPTGIEGIAYALTVATSQSPLADHGGILLDIDVFTRRSVPSTGSEFLSSLSTMHKEKNAIFESCITDQSRALFGGIK
jgi:uncharacterized protein (TIGR04255 family)